ncbi:hypothetical protein TNCV_4388611 [Trichonephila clavipes]|nr:hypothetical protein TNCV_4388611 [Trichonephila clavipes]
MDFTEINSRGKRGELLERIDGQNSRFGTAKTTIITFGLHASFVELESAKRALNEASLGIVNWSKFPTNSKRRTWDMQISKIPTDDVLSRVFNESSALEQVVAIYSGMAAEWAVLVSSLAKSVEIYSRKSHFRQLDESGQQFGSLQVPRDRAHSGQSFPWLSKTLRFWVMAVY